MRLFWTILVCSLLIGCASTPKKIILISTIPNEENWYNPLQEFELKTIHKGVVLYSPWIEIEVGKISKGIRWNETKGLDYQDPTKKIWGVRFIKRFFEPFVINNGRISRTGKVRP